MTDKRYRSGAEKALITDAAARSITAAKNKASDEKTARLKAARLKPDANLDANLPLRGRKPKAKP